MSLSIAYLGDQFSYHYLAAHKYLKEDAHCIGFETFDKIVDAILNDTCNLGILAIYNSITGFVFDKAHESSNIERIIKNDLQVIQSVQLQIQLQFGALSDIPFHQIEKIYSHHVALKEAKIFLSQFAKGILIEKNSTSSGVKEVAMKKLVNTAAIGNREAMEFFGLKILAENIDDHSDNFTKFLIIQKKSQFNLHTTNFLTPSSFVVQINQDIEFKKAILMADSQVLFLEQFSIQSQVYFYGEIQFENLEQKNNMKLKWLAMSLEIIFLN